MILKTTKYASLIKSTGIIGFSQAIKIITTILTTKFAAIFLGTSGVGIFGVIHNCISLLSSITQMGLQVAAVKEISSAQNSPKKELNFILLVLKNWALVVGFLGVIVGVIFSKNLSELSFGTTQKYQWFIFLSLSFIFSSLAEFYFATLRGLRKVKSIAVATLIIAVLSAISSSFFYYFFKIEGIFFSIVFNSIFSFTVYYLYSKRYFISMNSDYAFKNQYTAAKKIFKLGFLLSINVIFGYLCSLLVRLYLQHFANDNAILGIYQAGTTILITYFGVIFTTMGSDFYPKLVSISNDNRQIKNQTNHQIEFALLLITPAVLFCYWLAPQIIPILYSKEFILVYDFLKAAGLSIILKGVTWPLAFIILSKGDNKIYFYQELLGDFLNVLLSILLFYYFGVFGLGLAVLFQFLIYGLVIYPLVLKRHQFSFTYSTIKIILFSLAIGFIAFLNTLYKYQLQNLIFILLLAISCFFSWYYLRKK